MLSLQDFIGPLPVDEFNAGFWPAELYVNTSGPRRAELMDAVPELASTEQTLAEYKQPVRLSKKGGPYATAPTGADAIPAYRAGFTCVMMDLEQSFPALNDLIADAARVFGLPAASFRCEAFCSSQQSGLGMHSDFDVNLALLVHGNKRWRLAPNTSIENQTSTCFGRTGAQADPTQERYAHAPFPTTMPTGSVDVEMTSGGMVFVPRGWWHETYSSGDCLQVNLVMKGPHWAGLVSRALESLLLERAEWREYAYGIAATDERRAMATDELVELLDGLRREHTSADGRALAARLLEQADLEHVSVGSQRKAKKNSGEAR